jgi:hypothetical protein
MSLPLNLRSLAPAQQAILIHAAECDIAEASAWTRVPMRASDRIKIRAKITQQKKAVWQAKHGR